jgi:FAD/FMN-containing dehydrogenase
MASIETLKAELAGKVTLPQDAGYDAARKVWNGMIDQRPRAIVRCSAASDVVACVNFARASGWPLAVRGGGHNAAGLGVCDDGLVVDLSGMRSVEIDSASKVAAVGGGATWADFDGAALRHGLATTGGAVSTTGVAGLTLGGGIGWLMRSHGLACDNLVGVEMVTAAGETLRASASENPDLFWGVRGGGGNFGVVTRFEVRLHPIGTVLGGMLLYPIEKAREHLVAYRELMASAPDELTAFAVLMTTPDGARVFGIPLLYNGPPEEGEKVVRPLRQLGPIADMVGPMPYTQHQTMLDEGFPAGLQVYWRSAFLGGIPDAALDAFVASFSRVTSPLSAMLLESMGGAVARVDTDATAYNHRKAAYNLAIIGRWTNPAEASTHIAWVRAAQEAMQPFATGGVYVNYLGDEGQDRVRAAYGDAKYARLVALKNKYDPGNLFRRNQNIVPGRA